MNNESDESAYDETSSLQGSSSARRAPPRRRKDDGNGRVAPAFLTKAFAMIEFVSLEQGKDIAYWSPSGDSFIIQDINRFTEQIIPEYYKHKNFSSFVRQLNFYGFRKVKSDAVRTIWEFKHPRFLRGRSDLLCEIKRSEHFDTNSNSLSGNSDGHGLKREETETYTSSPSSWGIVDGVNNASSKDGEVAELKVIVHSLSEKVDYLEGLLREAGNAAAVEMDSETHSMLQKRKRGGVGNDASDGMLKMMNSSSYSAGAALEKKNSLQGLFDDIDWDTETFGCDIDEASGGSGSGSGSSSGSSSSSSSNSFSGGDGSVGARSPLKKSTSVIEPPQQQQQHQQQKPSSVSSSLKDKNSEIADIKELLLELPISVQEKFMDMYMLQFLPPHLQDKFLEKLADRISAHITSGLLLSDSASSSAATSSVLPKFKEVESVLSIEQVTSSLKAIQWNSLCTDPAKSQPVNFLTAAIGSFIMSPSS